MVIGIVGKANSGKDVVGNIIRYLTEGIDKAGVSFDKWDGQTLWGAKPFDWEIVKYADPLKECIAIMLGCDKSAFENREFKETPLPQHWQDHSTPEDPLTPRKILTRFGTDFGRRTLSENIWVNAVFSKYKKAESKWIITDVRFPNELGKIKSVDGFVIKVQRDPKKYFKPTTGNIVWCNFSGAWVLGKYLYEIPNKDSHVCDIIIQDKATSIRVVFDYNDLLPIEAEPNNHNGPENALNNYNQYDYTIDNNGTIEDLIENVRIILKKENII